MKSKRRWLIVTLTALDVIVLVLAYLHGAQAYSLQGAKDYLSAAGLTVAALILWYLAHNLFHELGHLVFAAATGGKILSFAACGFVIESTAKGRKISFDLRSGYAGWVGFVCENPNDAGKILFASLLGGFVGTAFTLIVILLVNLLIGGLFVYYLVFMGVFAVAYMFIVNYLDNGSSTDGRMLVSSVNGYEDFASAAIRLETESWLYLGKSLGEIGENYSAMKFGGKKRADLYDYYELLERGDTDNAVLVLDEISSESCLSDEETATVECERVFIACVKRDEKALEALKDGFLDGLDNSVGALRAHLAYRLYLGDGEWAERLKASYFKELELLPLKGFAATERKIYENYLK